jgi:short-subunit dehydrogenase
VTAPSEFRARYGPFALVLGGSEGIGREFAAQLAARGLDLVLLARRAAALESAAADIRAAHGVAVITRSVDLAAPRGVAEVAQELCAAHEIGLLVCNAGATHGAGAFLDEPLAKALALVQLNCLSVLSFAHPLLAAMRRRGRGGMIVVSSNSGLSGSGLIATYAAAKAFEISWCEGLHAEAAASGVDVLCAVAGLTDTPAMRRSGLSFSAAAEQGFTAMPAEAVARGALAHLGHGALWYAVGAPAAGAMRAMPREQLVTSMTQAAAALYNIPWR